MPQGHGLMGRRMVVVALLVVLLIPTLSVRVGAAGVTYTVDSTGYSSSVTMPNNGCAMGHAAGTCTLQEAILEANAVSPGTGNHHTINFSIPTTDPHYNAMTGVFTIQPTAQLPGVTMPTTIDGYSQPGAQANSMAVGTNAVLKIEIDGSAMLQACCIAWGMLINSGGSGSVVRGLVINRVPGEGVIVLGATGVTIAGNYIGTNAAGTLRLLNQNIAIQFSEGVMNSTIGGVTPDARNVLATDTCSMSINGDTSNNTFPSSGHNTVQGNYSGIKANGIEALPLNNGDNLGKAIQIIGGSTNNTIGGLTPGARNVFAGNALEILLTDPGTSANTVQGNYIGITANGTNLGLSTTELTTTNAKGVQIQAGATHNTIGGADPNTANVISGKNSAVVLTGDNTSDNLVQGNIIGADPTGTVAIGNINAGVKFSAGPSNNTVDSNLIANTTGSGVLIGDNVNDTNTTGNRVSANRIFANADPGIDLGSDGVTANAPGTRTGPNNLQNFPVLTNARGTTVTGSLNSAASSRFYVELFANPTAVRQGQTYLGFTTVDTDASGNASFTAAVPMLTSGQFVTATATNATTNDTSEFSAPLAVAGSGGGPTITTISPTSGDVRGGGIVRITGAGFVPGQTSLTVDGAPVTPTTVTATQITFVVPMHAAGSVTIVVTVNGQAVTQMNAYTYGVVRVQPMPKATTMPMGMPGVSAPPHTPVPTVVPAPQPQPVRH